MVSGRLGDVRNQNPSMARAVETKRPNPCGLLVGKIQNIAGVCTGVVLIIAGSLALRAALRHPGLLPPRPHVPLRQPLGTRGLPHGAGARHGAHGLPRPRGKSRGRPRRRGGARDQSRGQVKEVRGGDAVPQGRARIERAPRVRRGEGARRGRQRLGRKARRRRGEGAARGRSQGPVSYTHLTLPTILLV